MVLAIPSRSVGSYWTPVRGHGRSLGGYEILVMGGILETSLVIPGGYLEIYWGYLGNN